MTTAPIPSITDEQIAEIEALASDACQYAGHDWFMAPDLSAWFADDDAQFMAAASPFALLALISRLRAAESDAARYKYLKSRCDDGFIIELENHVFQSMWDQVIDAAMSEAKP